MSRHASAWMVVLCLLMVPAVALGQTVSFRDGQGAPVAAYAEKGQVFVRVEDSAANTSPAPDLVYVDLSTALAGDVEPLTLTETGGSTGVFAGGIRLGTSGAQPGVLETAADPGPPVVRDTITASYGAGISTATASLVGSFTEFRDTFGRAAAAFAPGETVVVRVTDFQLNNPLYRDSLTLTVAVPATGEQESLNLQETGFDTGVFQGSIPTGVASIYSGDGVLAVASGDAIEAVHLDTDQPTSSRADATIGGSDTELVDAQGQPAVYFLEGTRAYLRVVDNAANADPSLAESAQVLVSADLSGDQETVYLQETGPNTGVFTGWIGLRRGAGISGNSVLETSETTSPPYRFDTVRASHADAAGTSTDAVDMMGSLTFFLDAFGNEVTRYAAGANAYVRVEDHNANVDPTRFDTTVATVQSLTSGDAETLQLLEIAKDSGIFQGFVPTRGNTAPANGDGYLAVQADERIQAMHVDANGLLASGAEARIDEVSVGFIDEAGRPTVELLNGGLARVRVIAPGFNTDPYSANNFPGEIRTRYGADLEFVQLTETGPNTGVFEGSIRMHATDVGNVPGANNNGVLDTHTSGEPEYRGDEVTVSTGPFSATANVIPGRIVYLDAFGRETTTFAVGSTVRVRVTDHTRNASGLTREDFTVYLSVACTGDQEPVVVQETGFDTGIFEGAVNSSASASGNGTLQGAPGCAIVASHFTGYTPASVTAQARFSGGELLFIDAQGQPASVYMEGTRAYLRLVNHSLSGQVPVLVTTELSGDQEQAYLQETAPGSGIFETWLPLRRASQGIGYNNVLETSETQGPPHEFETLRASFFDPQTSEVSTATATTLNFRVWFIDAYGRVVTSYAQGSRAYVRVEDHNANDPVRYDTLGVTVRSALGDEEPLQLLETGGKESGVFEGSILLSDGPVAPGDGRLQAQAGGDIEARRDTQYNAAPAVARIDEVSILFVDEAGRPTVELLNGGLARVRVVAPGFNNDPYSANTLPAEIRTRYGADLEFMQLTETGANTGVFEGSIRMHATDVGNVPGANSNGVLDTHTSGEPEYRGDEVTVTSGPFSATANVIAARIVYLDAFGRETTTFAVGATVRVRVTDHTRNVSGLTREDFSLYLSVACTGDQESVLVRETGFDTGIFEGAVNSSASGSGNGTLQGAPGCVIEAYHFTGYTPASVTAQARFSGSELLFIDAQGQPVSVYMEGTRAYLRLVNHSLSGQVPVFVYTELSGDQEQAYLQETAPGSGVFETWLPLRRASQGIGYNNVLETSETQGPPHEFETLRASFYDPQTSEVSSATATTLNFRVWFIDAYGRVVTSYAQGSRAYVRVEDHNSNDPNRYDTLGVTVRSALGDEEPLELLETGGKESGVYEGSILLSDGPVAPGDGRLQTQQGSDIEARRDTQYNAAPAVAHIQEASVLFIDEAGRPTVELLNGGLARVRVVAPIFNNDPYSANTIPAEIRTRYGADLEYMQLTETGANTGVFEGSIRMHATDVGNVPGANNNGVLDTHTSGEPEYRGDEVTVISGPFSATANVIAARIVYLDAFGRETTAFAVGSTVRVRVTDYTRNVSSLTREDFSLYLSVACTGDQESVLVRETGFDTGIFEGAVNSSASGSGNGTLQGAPGCVIEAYHFTGYTPASVTAQARFSGSELLFIDAQGQPVSVYMEGTRAYLRLVNHSLSGQVPVFVYTELSGDQEQAYLQETAPGSGVFETWLPLRRASQGIGYNNVLETSETQGPPHEFETLRASFYDPQTSEVSTATATTLNFRVWFIDAYGRVVTSYAQGSRAYVRVEDHNSNDPNRYDTLGVTVRSALGDEEPLELLETGGKESGIFEGSILLSDGPAASGDGRLQAQAGGDIEARRDTQYNAAPAVARIQEASILFIDEAGRPTVELLNGGLARVRVVAPMFNSSPSLTDTTPAEIRTRYGADLEYMQLTETGPDTGVFEGSIRMRATDLGGSSANSNFVLETHTSGEPDYRGDEVTAVTGPFSATATVIPARIVFLDGYGRETTTFVPGSTVRVRVTDHTRNQSGTYQEDFTIYLTVPCTGDQEMVLVRETGFDTGVFEGSVNSRSQPGSWGDGTLQGAPSCAIEAFHYTGYTPGAVTAQARFVGSQLLFVDAQGQPASVYLEGTRAYIRVIDNSSFGPPPVMIFTELAGDQEMVYLNPTSPGSGIFEGWIPLRRASGNLGNNVLETSENPGPPHEFETLRASLYNPQTGESVTATATTTNFKVWFANAYGSVVTSYAQGSRVYVRMEDHNFNDPAFFDQAVVTVRSATGDEETVQMLETGNDTSIFQGSILMAAGPAAPGDYRLQAQPGTTIEARREGMFNADPAIATIEPVAIEFIDAAGRPTSELLSGDLARVRLFSLPANFSPGTAETTSVEVHSFYGNDVEQVQLTETGPDTSTFEGSIRLFPTDSNGSTVANNGRLETHGGPYPDYQDERVTANAGPISAQARVAPSRVMFIDSTGSEVSTILLGNPVRLRVLDAAHNFSSGYVDNLGLSLATACGDQEWIALTETGSDTGVFEGQVQSSASSAANYDNVLQGTAGCEITATHYNAYSPSQVQAKARFSGSELRFIDAQGQPASVYLESTRAYIRLRRPMGSVQETVEVTADITGDREWVTLTETAPGSGTFEGSLPLTSYGGGYWGDGSLQTGVLFGPPFQYETIRGRYYDGATSETSTATASTVGYRIEFLDADGVVTSSYAQGTRAYVRLEEHTYNNPTFVNRLYAVMGSEAGDQELLELTETGVDTSIYEGSIALASGPAASGDNQLQAMAGTEITADRQGAWVPAPARARIEGATIRFIDETGRTTVELVEGQTARVRVVSPQNDVNPGSAESITAILRSLRGTDQESVILTETGPSTGIFEGSIRLAVGPLSYGNGRLETAAGDVPDEVTASYGPYSATARVISARLSYLDVRGRATTTYPRHSTVRMRIEDARRNWQPGIAETIQVYLQKLDNPVDFETLNATETGPDTGVFEGSLPSDDVSGYEDGKVTGSTGAVIHASYMAGAYNVFLTADATFLGNIAPIARDDIFNVTSSESQVLPLTLNDNDPDGLIAGVIAVTQGTQGTVTLEYGTVTYTPNPGAAGQDTFTYVVADYEAAEAMATVTIVFNRPPVANDDTATVDEDGSVVIPVLANDNDPEGGSLRFGSYGGGAAHGTVTLNEDYTLTYTPAANYHGPDSFTYTIADAADLTATATVTITVNSINDLPVAGNDTLTQQEDTVGYVYVLDNDADADGDALSITNVSAPSPSGTATFLPDLRMRYVPVNNFNGVATFSYTVSDGHGGTSTATVTVTVTPDNDPPVANTDSVTVLEDGTVNANVLANDTDVEGNTLSVTAVTQGAHGTVSINPDKTVKYKPAANYNGPDSFTYTISDGNGGTATGTASITVTPVPDAPVAVNDTATMVEDGTTVIDVVANDTDADGDALTVVSYTAPTFGTASITLDNKIRFTPNPNFSGPAFFTYTVSDPSARTATATIQVNVTAVNDAPVAANDNATVAEDGTVNVSVLANDNDPDFDTLTVTAVTQGTHGAVSINPDKTVKYTPAANYNGPDSFTYTISDGTVTATATVSVTVTPVNDAPVANADSATVAEDGSVDIPVLANDTDVDGNTLTVSSVTQGTNGTVSINADNTVRYVPAANYGGSDSFTYTVSDGNGGTATATVSVTVTAVNDAPVANADSATVAEDGNVSVTVLANDTDADGDTLTVSSVTQGTHGTVVINPDKTVKYTPAANYNGSDSFTYTVSDGNGGTATATVSVTVTAVNDAPVANADSATVAEDGGVNVTVLANDTDADGDTLTVSAVTQGAHGAVSINPDKTVRYVPAANYNGADSFTYTVSDGTATATATVAINVTSVNDTPIANADSITVAEDGAVNAAVLANDTDPEGNTLSVTAVTQGTKGVVSINPDKTVRYVPAANANGADSFTYTLSDGNGGTATATVTVTITPVNDPPVAVNDSAAVQAGGSVIISVLGNDSDIDSASLTVTSVTQGTRGTVAINANGTVTYTASMYVGADSFTYTVSDGNGGTATATVNVTLTRPGRVSSGIQAFYDFGEGSGSTVTDTSGVGTPLNLTISNTAAVTWLPGALSINAETIVGSAGAATKVNNAVKASNAVTLEAWVAADNLTQTGPARLFSIAKNGTQRNVLFGQSANRWEAQLKTSSTTATLQSPANSVGLTLTHVVYVRNSTGQAYLYIDGTQVATQTTTGNLSGWDATYKLALANEVSGGKVWLGDLYQVAIYGRALSAAEVQQNFLAGGN